MSLLLEALKKAEKAKEEAQRRARGEPEPAAPAPQASYPPKAPAALSLEGEPAAPEPRRVTTRAELPDIGTSMDIADDDLGPKAAPQPPREELRLEGAKEAPRRTTGAQAAATQQAAAQSSDRATGRKVFEAKFKEPNPKLPFYLTVGALAVFAVSIVIYFWYQLRPPYPLVNTNPPRPTETVAAVPQQAAPVAAVAPRPQPTTVIPGLPSNPPATTSAPPAARPPAARPSTPPPEQPVLSPQPRLAAPSVNAPPAPPRTGPELSVNRATPQIHPKVDSGYAAYQAGNLAKARAEYELALAEDPGNRDALLGLAAVETRSGRYEVAEAHYLRLLQLQPRDPHAQAGLLALRGARQDPLVSESRVKTLLAQDPGAHALNFTLGNQLAQQGRWGEAQQEYFKAFSGDPENADFAYNLAVSLDHLRQPRAAREYYLRAIALAERRGASFDLVAARARAAQLAN